MAYKKSNPNGQAAMTASEPVVIASDQSAVPVTVSGVSTAANQTTIIGHVDGIETLIGTTNTTLGTIDTDTGNISTKIDTLAGAVAGTEVQVDVLTMPTVTVTATNLDVQSGGADLATTTQAGAIQTAVELLDDTVVADDAAFTPATTKVQMAGFVFDNVTPDSIDEGDAGAARMSANRNVYTTVRDAAGNERGQNVDASGNAGVVLAAETTKVIGTVRAASGGFASGSIASGAIAAGAIAAGATSIATTEDTASAAADHLVKIAARRTDTPVANDNLSNDGDYTQLKLSNFGKLWVAGSVPEDTAHIDLEPILQNGSRRIDTPATSAGASGDWATSNQSAEGADWGTLTPTTTGGCTIFRTLDLDESEEEVKATAGNVYGYYFYNAATSVRYLKFYNATAASVSVGTTTPVLTFPLPASSAGHIAFPYAAGFATAICVAATTGLADADTGAPAANDVILNVFYK